jgi:hypothetical protein
VHSDMIGLTRNQSQKPVIFHHWSKNTRTSCRY